MAMTEQGNTSATDIAIIGMALRVPGANKVEQFWHNLRSGVESICSLTQEELLAAGESADTRIAYLQKLRVRSAA